MWYRNDTSTWYRIDTYTSIILIPITESNFKDWILKLEKYSTNLSKSLDFFLEFSIIVERYQR